MKWQPVGLIVVVLMLWACSDARSLEIESMSPEQAEALLAEAIQEGDQARMEQLIQAGVDVNATNKAGTSMLMWAFFSQRLPEFKRLLAEGADPTIQDDNGKTVIHYAAGLNSIDYLEVLLAAGVPVDIENRAGETPLFEAIGDNPRRVDLLLQHGADINHQARMGNTPLHIAAAVNDYDSLLKLLHRGADPRLKNKQGATFQYALATGPAEEAYTQKAQQQRNTFRQWLRDHDVEVTF
ncbi:hypothetical protein BFW38_04150 [Terasakiispira papahanaumokuakeensis]|uniref:Uncharacterized protein n=1 Tax=Terasakiispira papahanaumokuakeensis TaxID=197479 RepID=A0A1E2V7H0_9GAMM|nr:ankyrin repeat domain-containing protein [Terasakiispira papahanaumokuakeensis]ODC02863.1 hypothetical protein BFW38_04150 [Terasakiispira papahanaumokuakeensis]